MTIRLKSIAGDESLRLYQLPGGHWEFRLDLDDDTVVYDAFEDSEIKRLRDYLGGPYTDPAELRGQGFGILPDGEDGYRVFFDINALEGRVNKTKWADLSHADAIRVANYLLERSGPHTEPEPKQANLGLATTQQLLDELTARIRGKHGLNYTTVGGEPEPVPIGWEKTGNHLVGRNEDGTVTYIETSSVEEKTDRDENVDGETVLDVLVEEEASTSIVGEYLHTNQPVTIIHNHYHGDIHYG